MSKNLSRRRWLAAGAATAAVSASGVALAQSGSQAPGGYKFRIALYPVWSKNSQVALNQKPEKMLNG
jgi:hypothetical protein